MELPVEILKQLSLWAVKTNEESVYLTPREQSIIAIVGLLDQVGNDEWYNTGNGYDDRYTKLSDTVAQLSEEVASYNN